MAVVIFILLVIVAIYFKVRFHQTTSAVHNLCVQNDWSVFEAKYVSANQMRRDLTFLNKLWVGKSIEGIPDEALRLELKNARNFFKYQIFLGLLAFVSVVISSFIDA